MASALDDAAHLFHAPATVANNLLRARGEMKKADVSLSALTIRSVVEKRAAQDSNLQPSVP